MIELIGLDADDTLWHNEVLYREAQDGFSRLLRPYAPPEAAARRLFETEMRNLSAYGYGIKSFTLSMIETAIGLTGGAVRAEEIAQIIGLGRSMLAADVRLVDGARETVCCLAKSHRLVLITKGDLLDQQRKLDRSGLAPCFHSVEIVSEKAVATYRGMLERYAVSPHRFLMVGNSLRSDILPVVELGGHAAYVPHDLTWEHERVSDPQAQAAGYHQLENLHQLPALVERLDGSAVSFTLAGGNDVD